MKKAAVHLRPFCFLSGLNENVQLASGTRTHLLAVKVTFFETDECGNATDIVLRRNLRAFINVHFNHGQFFTLLFRNGVEVWGNHFAG